MESFGVRVASLHMCWRATKWRMKLPDMVRAQLFRLVGLCLRFMMPFPTRGSDAPERMCRQFQLGSDHARRLNLEASKAVKYGQLPEAEAPTCFERAEDRLLGRIAAEKDDLALGQPTHWITEPHVWNKIDGKLFHSLEHTRDRSERRAKEREELVEKARDLINGRTPPRTPQPPKKNSSDWHWRRAATSSLIHAEPMIAPKKG